MNDWQAPFLEEIRAVDREQSTHGLYGLREALSRDGKLVPLANLLGGEIPQTNVPGRLGWRVLRPRRNGNIFALPTDAEVSVSVLTLTSRTWADLYGRGFHTGLFLWSASV